MKFLAKYWRESLLLTLFLCNVAVWMLVYQNRPTNALSIYFLNVGQGDAIFIESPMKGRVLIDGGPDRKVLRELGKALPFGDKRIDVVIETHPDADHISGLVDVIKRYKVGVFIAPGVESANKVDDALEKAVSENSITNLKARRGMNIDLGGGAHLLILFPNQDVSKWDTNDASIVAKLTYGSKSFLLTGDAAKKTEFILLGLNRNLLDADVLKAGHHGSRTSTNSLFAAAVTPEYGVISAGKDNSYGHPHKEVIEILNNLGTEIVSTINRGTIVFETDGESLILK